MPAPRPWTSLLQSHEGGMSVVLAAQATVRVLQPELTDQSVMSGHCPARSCLGLSAGKKAAYCSSHSPFLSPRGQDLKGKFWTKTQSTRQNWSLYKLSPMRASASPSVK